MDEKLKQNENYYMILSEAAEYMRVSQSFLHKKMKDPECDIPHMRVGKKYLFRKPDLDKWLREGAEK